MAEAKNRDSIEIQAPDFRIFRLKCVFRGSGRQVALPAELVGDGAELVVPRIAEAAAQGPSEEAIDGQVEASAQFASAAADVPLVVVECGGAVGERLLADGIEGAADGLNEVRSEK